MRRFRMPRRSTCCRPSPAARHSRRHRHQLAQGQRGRRCPDPAGPADRCGRLSPAQTASPRSALRTTAHSAPAAPPTPRREGCEGRPRGQARTRHTDRIGRRLRRIRTRRRGSSSSARCSSAHPPANRGLTPRRALRYSETAGRCSRTRHNSDSTKGSSVVSFVSRPSRRTMPSSKPR